MQTYGCLSTRKPLLRALWVAGKCCPGPVGTEGWRGSPASIKEQTVQGSGQRAVRGEGAPPSPQEPGISAERTGGGWMAMSRAQLRGHRVARQRCIQKHSGQGCYVGEGGTASGPHPEDQPRGFLWAGSWVTAKATEPCPRSQVYLWRHRWAGVRQVGPEDPRGRRVVPQLGGAASPPVHSRVPGWYQKAVIRGQAQVLFPHRHHRGALLGKRSRRMGMEAVGPQHLSRGP